MPDFGTDLSAVPDLTGALHAGSDNLVEALIRRLKTPKGSLFYDREYGSTLYDWLGEGISDQGIGCAVSVEADLEEDPRVRSATATVEDFHARGIQLAVAVETAAGPFVLVVAGEFAGQAISPNITVNARGEDY